MTSRRELRERAGHTSPRTLPTWMPRAAVLVALAAATIAVPAVDMLTPGPAAAEASAGVGYPSTHEVLSGSVLQTTPTSLLASVPDAQRVSDTTSRALDRNPLPGCDGEARVASANGQIPESDMCTLWDGTHMLRGDAAVSLAQLHEHFKVAFGRDLCITDSYRSLSAQRRVAALRGSLAATPGTSNHGWGLAIDLCSAETRSSAVITWLFDNAPVYGWENPPWAQRGGSGPYEPWHWEYVPGTVEMGTDWSRD